MSTPRLRWTLGLREFPSLLPIAAIVFVARLGALTTGFAPDDYTFLQQGTTWADYWPLYSQGGRPVAALIMVGLTLLGGPQPQAFPAAVAFSILGYTLVGYLIARRGFLLQSRLAIVLVASLVAAHPFFAELFSYRVATLVSALAFLFTTVALLSFSPRRSAVLPAAGLFALGLATYQVSLGLSWFLLLSLTACFAAEALWAGSTPGRRHAYMRSRIYFAGTVLVLGTVLYYAAIQGLSRAHVILLVWRTPLLSMADVPERLAQVVAIARNMFIDADAMIPALVKIVLWIPLIVVGERSVRAAVRSSDPSRAAALGALVVLSVAGMVLGVGGVSTALKDWWMMPRVLGHTCLFWVWPVAVLYRTRHPSLRAVATACSVLVLASYLLISGRVLEDQKRINRRDAALANRLVERLQALDGYAAVRTIVLVKPHTSYPDDNVLVTGDFNISALYPTWSQEALIEEVTGIDVTLMATAGELARAEAFCQGRPVWPASGSVGIDGALGIVCFPAP